MIKVKVSELQKHLCDRDVKKVVYAYRTGKLKKLSHLLSFYGITVNGGFGSGNQRKKKTVDNEWV